MVQNTCNIYFTTSQSLSKIIRIIMETYTELSAEVHNQEFFRVKEISWNKGTSINIPDTTYEREAPQGRLSEFFTSRNS